VFPAVKAEATNLAESRHRHKRRGRLLRLLVLLQVKPLLNARIAECPLWIAMKESNDTLPDIHDALFTSGFWSHIISPNPHQFSVGVAASDNQHCLGFPFRCSSDTLILNGVSRMCPSDG